MQADVVAAVIEMVAEVNGVAAVRVDGEGGGVSK